MEVKGEIAEGDNQPYIQAVKLSVFITEAFHLHPFSFYRTDQVLLQS